MDHFVKGFLLKERMNVPDASRTETVLYTFKTAASAINDAEKLRI